MVIEVAGQNEIIEAQNEVITNQKLEIQKRWNQVDILKKEVEGVLTEAKDMKKAYEANKRTEEILE